MGASDSRLLTGKLGSGEEDDRVKYATSSMKGLREKMEDASAAILDLDGSKSTSFFGVYDGHGGADVALYCAKRFHVELVGDLDYNNNLATAIRHTFFRIDENLQQSDEWRELANPGGKGKWIKRLKIGPCAANFWRTEGPYVGPQLEGSTACVVLIRGDQIIVGNVGDSRCVLSKNGQAIPLSTDHKPKYRDEKSRIERAGGEARRDGFAKILPGRVVDMPLGIYRVNGKLAVSRAIGDFEFKQNKSLSPEEQMVTCNPDIQIVDITDDTEFLLIASDGIWDVMKSESVVNFVRDYIRSGETDLRAICDRLLDYCVQSNDNSTVILVQFKGASIPSFEAPARIPPPLPRATADFDPTNIASSSATEAMDDTDEITEITDEITEITEVNEKEIHDPLLPLRDDESWEF